MEVRPIDANALLTVPNVNKVTEYDETGCGISYNAVSVESIEKAPTLDYAPVVHGEWMDNVDENGFLRNAWRKCSACGGLNYSKKPNYCPNCGAKMRGEAGAE